MTTTSTGVEELQVRSGAAVLHVECRGPADGPVVVLVHGYPDDLRTWDLVAEHLATDHRVVTFDLRGMGRSTVPTTEDSHAMARLCEDIDAVATAVTGSPEGAFHLVGHDWGSIIGWSYVADSGPRARVLSWTSISAPHAGVGGPFLRSRSRAALRQSLASTYILVFQKRGLAEAAWKRRAVPMLRKILTGSGVPDDDPILDRTSEEILAFALPGLELYRQNLNPLRLPEPPAPRSVTTPTLLVVAQDDQHVTPPLALASAPLCTDISVLELAAGHWVVRSHPELLADAIARHVAGEKVGGPVPPTAKRRPRGSKPGMDGAGTPGGRRGKVVLVTGAGSGIGRATALDAATEGAHLVLLEREAGAAADTAERCQQMGGTAEVHVVDVTDRDAMAAVAEKVLAMHGAPDVLVNNAGVGMGGPFTAMGMDDWDWIRSVNLDGVVLGCHLYVPAMVERGSGHVVNLASMAGLVPVRNMTAYNATKFAVVGFSDALAADLWSSGVAVTAVCPGIVHTGIISGTRLLGDPDAEKNRARAEKAYKRRGFGPERVADAIWAAVADRKGGVLPVSFEARLGHRIRRFAPRLATRLSRTNALGGK
ncbi:SDR family oxidoreductase [Actinospongicola halichondriae]|uniref:SDR family oxidoreductase n=1 Tax=Actinospongicola halichondriae TaxID=3236844 RepID=UPI003D4C5E09